MAKKYGIQIKGLGRALRPSGLGVLRPKPTDKGGKPFKPQPIKPGKAEGGRIGVQDGTSKPKNFPKGKPKDPREKFALENMKSKITSGKRIKRAGGGKAKKFPDLTGDGKVTRADVLKGRGVFAEGGKVKVKDKVKDKGAFETESRRQRQKQRQRIKKIGEGLRNINPLPLPKLKKKDK